MDIISKISDGHSQFRQNLSEACREFYSSLAMGQEPEVLFITCSDSRVDPSLKTGTSPGELFVIRNAGNIVPLATKRYSGDLGSMQFAIDVLGVKHVVVCGHTDCGAVKGLLSPESLEGLPYLHNWIRGCECDEKLDPSLSLVENVKIHTLNQVERLHQLSFVEEKVRSGALELHAWLLDISKAEIVKYSQQDQDWLPL